MTPYQEAVKRYTDSGGAWPPKAALPRWSGSGRWLPLARRSGSGGSSPVRCVECGHESKKTAVCPLCGEQL